MIDPVDLRVERNSRGLPNRLRLRHASPLSGCPGRLKSALALPWRENVIPDVGSNACSRYFHRRFDIDGTQVANVEVSIDVWRDAPAKRDCTPILVHGCLRTLEAPGREDILCNPLGHSHGGVPDGVAGEMCVAGGGLDLGMAEELRNHRQALTQRQRAAGVGVAYTMYVFR